LQQNCRSASTRSLVPHRSSSKGSSTGDDEETKAKAVALAERVRRIKAEKEPGALQRRPVVRDSGSASSTSSDLSEPTTIPALASANSAVIVAPTAPTHRLEIPVVQDDVHPVLCLLSGDLWSDDKAIVVGAFHQLANLCRDDDQNQSIFSLAGYCTLCGVVRKWYHEATVLTAAFRLIPEASEDFAAGAIGSGALEYIVGAMRKFAMDGPLQAAACGALATLVSSTSAIGPSIKLAIHLSGPVVLTEAIASFPGSIELQENVTATFRSMARFPQLHAHLKIGSILVHASMDKDGLTTCSLGQQLEVAAADNDHGGSGVVHQKHSVSAQGA
jgi:hypothetical protein